MLTFEAARERIAEVLRARAKAVVTEPIEFVADPARALGRILAEDVMADRDYPAFDRSVRDGYAVRAADAAAPGARLRLIGESRAGVAFEGAVAAGTCVQIMTGAAMPRGADSVVMQEYARPNGDSVVFEKAAEAGQHIVPAGREARAGQIAVASGARIGYAELAMAAQVGRTKLIVARRPRVAILATGDEIVAVDATPGPFQIRNSNSVSLAAQVVLAGAEPAILGGAPDELGELRRQIERGLEADILVLSGGVSVGKYDLVEQVLRELGAEFFFDAIAIRPGKPAVFGWCKGKPVFGLPGNPVSTMVTFELLVTPAIDLLSGRGPQPLPLFKARLKRAIDEKPPLSHFLPARVSWTGGEASVEAVAWEGSGDIGAVVRGNCFIVAHASRLKITAGEWADVLPLRGAF
jgi:molybdopterin molybdotransferase